MKQIYIGNIPLNKSEQDILQLFMPFGQVLSLQLVKERGTDKPRGFGFVQMVSDSCADEAIAQLEGRLYDGKVLRVNEARPLNPRPPRDTW